MARKKERVIVEARLITTMNARNWVSTLFKSRKIKTKKAKLVKSLTKNDFPDFVENGPPSHSVRAGKGEYEG